MRRRSNGSPKPGCACFHLTTPAATQHGPVVPGFLQAADDLSAALRFRGKRPLWQPPPRPASGYSMGAAMLSGCTCREAGGCGPCASAGEQSHGGYARRSWHTYRRVFAYAHYPALYFIAARFDCAPCAAPPHRLPLSPGRRCCSSAACTTGSLPLHRSSILAHLHARKPQAQAPALGPSRSTTATPTLLFGATRSEANPAPHGTDHPLPPPRKSDEMKKLLTNFYPADIIAELSGNAAIAQQVERILGKDEVPVRI